LRKAGFHAGLLLFGDRFPVHGKSNFTTEDHTLKLGVNYRFNFASPVVARY